MGGWSGGVYTRFRNWVSDKANSINPQAALFDQEDDGFAGGLNNCVTKDGLNKPSAAMDWNGQNLTGVLNFANTGTVQLSGGKVTVNSTGNIVIIPISGVNRAVIRAVDYARSRPGDIRAVLVDIDPEKTCRLEMQWAQWGGGVNLVVVVEEALPPPAVLDAWRSVVTPLVNVTRFHQAAPVMIVRHATADALSGVPPSIGLCGSEGTTIAGPANRLRGVTLAAEPKEWAAPPPGTPLTLTAGVVPGSFRFAEVLEACRRVTDGLVP